MIDQLTAEYNETAARIESARLASWSTVSEQYEIAGIRLRQLTLQAWIDLKASGNALLYGQEPDEVDLVAYLWRNHPRYGKKANQKAQKAIIEAVRKSNVLEIAVGISEHIEDAFAETPENASASGGYSRASGFPAVAGFVYAIDEIGHRYGMKPCEVLMLPLSQIYQLQKAIRHQTQEKYKPAVPEPLRRISGKILEAINNGKG